MADETLQDLQKQLVGLKVKLAVENAQKKRRAGYRDPAYDPTEGTGEFLGMKLGKTDESSKELENYLAAGAGSVKRAALGAGNILLTDSPEAFSDKALKEHDEMTGPLKSTKAGLAGDITGSALATAPLGGGWGAVPKIAANSGKVLKFATGLTGRGAIEGGVSSALYADPDKRGDKALEGAGIGGGLGLGGSVLGRTIRGVAQKSPDAENLRFMADQYGEKSFVPLAQAVGDEGDILSRGIKTLYKEALPYIPGVSGKVQKQYRELGDTFRNVSLKEADKFGVLTPAHLKNPEAAVAELKKAIDDGYRNSVKSYTFDLPDAGLRARQMTTRLKQAHPNIDPTTLKKTIDEAEKHFDRFSGGQPKIAGENLLNAKNAINTAIETARGPEKTALATIVEMIEHRFQTRMKGPDHEVYMKAKDAWKDFLALSSVTRHVDEYTPTHLRRASKKGTDERQVARTFGKVLKGAVGMPGAAGRVGNKMLQTAVGWGGVGTLGAVAGLPIMLGTLGGANALATKGVQKTLMGDTAMQRKLIEALRRDPTLSRMLGSAGRGAVTAETAKE